MPDDGDEPGSNAPSAVSLARTLRTLKRRGSNLLVVGLTSDEGYGRICRRMLGDDTAGPRRRLLVVTGADPEAVTDRARRTQRLPPETTRHVRYVTTARSASGGPPAEGSPDDDTPDDEVSTDEPATGGTRNDEAAGADGKAGRLPDGRRIESGQLTDLGDAIEAEIGAIEAEADELAPAELRVCLDSVTPLLDAHDREAVLGFLDRVTTRVADARGMGHVHLPVARDWEAVADLENPFDAVVELRVEQGRTQQRWHLRDADVTSDWFGL
jgi:hypothetical protein